MRSFFGPSVRGRLGTRRCAKGQGSEYRVSPMGGNHLYSTPPRIGPEAEVNAKSSQLGGAITALQVMRKSNLRHMCREALVSMRWRQKKAAPLGTWCFPKLGPRSSEARNAHVKHAIGRLGRRQLMRHLQGHEADVSSEYRGTSRRTRQHGRVSWRRCVVRVESGRGRVSFPICVYQPHVHCHSEHISPNR